MDSEISMKRFENWTGEAPGYSAYISHSVPRLLSSVGEVIVGDLSLGRADVNGQRIVVASNNSPQTNFVIFVDGGNLLALQGDHPVIATRKLEESIHDIRWLNESSVVCATANRNLLTFQLERDHSVKQCGMIDNIHTGFIREIAVKNAWEPLVASGGYDGCLCISDMSTDSTLQRATLDDCVIGSVKWTELNSNVCVSVTTDDGYYFLYDTRTALIRPAVTTNLMQADLFTHCRYTDHHVLLGYGDGEIKQIDMRKPNHIVCSVTDPFVHGVGDIEFNPDSQSFAISGFADCSVWKIGPDGTTRIHSHTASRSNVLTSRDVYCTSATYFGPASVLVSDSLGRLDVIKQAF